MEETRKRCSRCGVDHPLHFFSKSRTVRNGIISKDYKRSVCKACTSRERIEKKKNDIFEQKARNTINSHAERMGLSFREWLFRHDLTIDYIKMLFRREHKLHELGFVCLNCGHAHKAELFDFTLDMIDPKRPPTRSNLRIICRTCNVEKGAKDPTEYDFEAAEYRRNRNAIKGGVQFVMPSPAGPILNETMPLQFN